MELLGAIIGSLLGALVALVVASLRLRRESEQWRQDALVKGMGFLTGGRQERSVGIGLLETLVLGGNVPDAIRPAVDNVIWNQLNYVVFHGDVSRRHETINALRLAALIDQSPKKVAIAAYSDSRLAEIRGRIPVLGE